MLREKEETKFSSFSLNIYKQSCSVPSTSTNKAVPFPSTTTNKLLPFSPKNYEQGVQGFGFGGLYLFTENTKIKMKEWDFLVLSPSFTPFNIILD